MNASDLTPAYDEPKAAAERCVGLAAAHVARGSMPDSAQLTLNDASLLLTRGDYVSAMRRAKDSLEYSVGVFHNATQEATALFRAFDK